MMVVIFESWPLPGQKQTYIDMATSLKAELETIDGFISIERYQSVTDSGKLVALSFWRDEEAINAWRNRPVHRSIQASSRAAVFQDYRLRVGKIIRDYTKHDRAEAPADSQRLATGTVEPSTSDTSRPF